MIAERPDKARTGGGEHPDARPPERGDPNMIAQKPMRFAALLLIVMTLWIGNAGCIASDVPAEWVALVGLSWFKDLVIGDKLRIDFLTPPDGCYQDGQLVDCATMNQ
jgi:hypothetical protein